MVEWKYVIQETSTYYVELDTSDPEEAEEIIKWMMAEGQIDVMRPDLYANEGNAYLI